MTELDAVRAATREAHAAIKDLRREIREAQVVVEALRAILPTITKAQIDREVSKQIDVVQTKLTADIERESAAIHKAFRVLQRRLAQSITTRQDGIEAFITIVEGLMDDD